jgi:hypothetical protein
MNMEKNGQWWKRMTRTILFDIDYVGIRKDLVRTVTVFLLVYIRDLVVHYIPLEFHFPDCLQNIMSQLQLF